MESIPLRELLELFANGNDELVQQMRRFAPVVLVDPTNMALQTEATLTWIMGTPHKPLNMLGDTIGYLRLVRFEQVITKGATYRLPNKMLVTVIDELIHHAGMCFVRCQESWGKRAGMKYLTSLLERV